MDFKAFAMNSVENAVAASMVSMVGLDRKLPNNNVYEQALGNGAVMTLAEEAVRWYNTGTTKLQQSAYYSLVDDVVFNGVMFYGVSRSSIPRMGLDLLENVPLNGEQKGALITGTVIALGRTVAETLDTNPTFASSPLQYVVHPTRLFVN